MGHVSQNEWEQISVQPKDVCWHLRQIIKQIIMMREKQTRQLKKHFPKVKLKHAKTWQ